MWKHGKCNQNFHMPQCDFCNRLGHTDENCHIGVESEAKVEERKKRIQETNEKDRIEKGENLTVEEEMDLRYPLQNIAMFMGK